jgi:hypothetical protein
MLRYIMKVKVGGSIIYRTLAMRELQVVSNLCLKINSKLGGVNHHLAAQSRPACLQVRRAPLLNPLQTRADQFCVEYVLKD